MAGTAGQTPTGLVSALLNRGHEFSFAQVMRLLRLIQRQQAEEEVAGKECSNRIRIRPELSLGFPASDVTSVEQDETGFQVTASFLGLYGASSPLPSFYSEDLLDEASTDGTVCRDFLDIIHQRLYSLYFQCWRKYRISVQVAEGYDQSNLDKLYCLLGLGEAELRDGLPDSYSLVRYVGLFSLFPHSAWGLETLLKDALGGMPLSVIQCVGRMVPISPDQRLSLGVSGCGLGIDSVIGSEIADRMGKIRLQIGPLPIDDFRVLLPGEVQYQQVASLVSLYLTDPLECDLELILAEDEAATTCLGAPMFSRLGLNTWSFSDNRSGELRTTFPLTIN